MLNSHPFTNKSSALTILQSRPASFAELIDFAEEVASELPMPPLCSERIRLIVQAALDSTYLLFIAAVHGDPSAAAMRLHAEQFIREALIPAAEAHVC